MNIKVSVAAAAIAAASVLIVSFNGAPSRLRGDADDDGGLLEVIPVGEASGPESLAFDSRGEGPYTGVSDGRILKWDQVERRWAQFAVTSKERLDKCKGSRDPELEHFCGRPLGLRFNKKTGDLYIADAYLGLLVVGSNDTFATPVATQIQGIPFYFTNNLDIDQESGIIYFTESSTRFRRREFMSVLLSSDNTGRLLKYDPRSKEVQILLNGLSFPNGVALSDDGSFLLIAETSTCRILRYSLRDPLTTEFEVVAELPGFPDNIKWSPRGGFWVAIHSRRGRLIDWLLSRPWLGELLLKIPINLQRWASIVSGRKGHALAIRLSTEGEVLEVLAGLGGRMKFISEVEEHNGSLWIGSVLMPFVGVYKL